jgi:hypothetical protein
MSGSNPDLLLIVKRESSITEVSGPRYVMQPFFQGRGYARNAKELLFRGAAGMEGSWAAAITQNAGISGAFSISSMNRPLTMTN